MLFYSSVQYGMNYQNKYWLFVSQMATNLSIFTWNISFFSRRQYAFRKIWVTRHVSYKKQGPLTLGFISGALMSFVLLCFLYICLVCLMLLMSLAYGFCRFWKTLKDLLDNLKSRYFSQVSSIKTLDLSTLYTTLPHDKLKSHLKETIHKAFNHRNYGSKFVVLGYNSTYFSNKIQKGTTCYSAEQVISMLRFLIDNIFVSFGGTLFQQIVVIPIVPLF